MRFSGIIKGIKERPRKCWKHNPRPNPNSRLSRKGLPLMVPKICSIPQCEKHGRLTRGMCRYHYQKALRDGTIEKLPVASVEDRFWEKVVKTDYCWEWRQAIGKSTYGRFSVGYQQFLAHRFSYALAHGEIAEGIEIDHTCHNKACVNPEHLREATHKQNLEHRSGAQSNSKSRVRGVSWHSLANKWVAQVKHNGEQIYLGLFTSLADAESAVISKRNALYTHNDLDRIA